MGPTGLTLAAVARDAGMDTPESCAHHLAFLCTDLTDPQLYERALAVHRARRRAIEALLTEAADAGELRAGTDAAALAGTVQAITAGAGLCWAVERRGGLAERLRRELDAVLREYGFTDADGTRPDFAAHWAKSLEAEHGPLGDPSDGRW